MSANELIERTNQRLGGVQSPMMEGDNLAILLCTYFENPDQECEDDTCWTPDSIKGQEEVLDAIRAHYQPMADLLASHEAEIERLESALRIALWNEAIVRGLSQDAAIEQVEARIKALKGTGADHG